MVDENENTTMYEVEGTDVGPEHVSTSGGEEITEEESTEVESHEEEVVEATPAETTQEEVESYTPDYSYKVQDDLKEIPEVFRSIIKSKEEEDLVRDVFTRADGLDLVKEKNTRLTEEFDELNGNNTKMVDRLEELQYFIDKGHLGHFFDQIGVPQQDIVNYVAQLLREQDDPSLAQQSQQMMQSDIASYEQGRSTNLLQQQNAQLRQNQFNLEMQTAMSMPEADKVRDYVDSKQGAGTFRKLVDQHGLAHYAQTGSDTTATAAVQAVVNQFSGLIGNDVATGNGLAEAQKAQKQGRPGGHLPNVGRGSQASPVKKQVKSIAELKKLAETMIEAG